MPQIQMQDENNVGLKTNQTTSTLGDQSQYQVILKDAQINVFFDGTGNNIYNVEAFNKDGGATTQGVDPEILQMIREKYKDDEDSSYQGAASNVARMWRGVTQNPTITSVYVEGIGTAKYKSDSQLGGYAAGMGETGVVERVLGAFRQIQEGYKEIGKEKQLPAIFEVNVYGFSRGAAAARHFVYLLNTEKDRDKDSRYFVDQWQMPQMHVNFVGLFDCVAHLGLIQRNDVEQLHLNFSEKNPACKVFHLVAGDEYRDNFMSTNINSAVALREPDSGNSVGYQLTIPGAHSDVGGGCHDKDLRQEVHSFKSGSSLERWILDQGWYMASNRVDMPKRSSVGAYARQVSSDYYKISLTLMVEKAQQYSRTQFSDDLVKPPAHSELQDLHRILRSYAKDEMHIEWNLDREYGQAALGIRNNFLHLSFYCDPYSIAELFDPKNLYEHVKRNVAHGPALDGHSGLPKRGVLPG